jgi:hypothetical protein
MGAATQKPKQNKDRNRQTKIKQKQQSSQTPPKTPKLKQQNKRNLPPTYTPHKQTTHRETDQQWTIRGQANTDTDRRNYQGM